MKEQAMYVAITEEIRQALLDGSFEQKADVIKLKAVEYGFSEEQINKMIEKEQEKLKSASQIKSITSKNKILICAIMLVCVVLEWFLPCGWIWIILLNIITIILVVFIAAIVIRKKVNRL